MADKPAKSVEVKTLSCSWLRRVGLYGFLFFLIKGLLWLIVPLALVYFGVWD